MVDYAETIEVYDIEVGIYSKLNEYMEIFMYQSLTCFQSHSYFIISNSFCPEAT